MVCRMGNLMFTSQHKCSIAVLVGILSYVRPHINAIAYRFDLSLVDPRVSISYQLINYNYEYISVILLQNSHRVSLSTDTLSEKVRENVIKSLMWNV